MTRHVFQALVLATMVSGAPSPFAFGAPPAEHAPDDVAADASAERRPPPASVAAPGASFARPPSIATVRIPDVVTMPEGEAPPRGPRPFRWVPGRTVPPTAEEMLRDYRQQLGDPHERAALKGNAVAALREMLPDVDDALGLDDASVERFLGVIVEGNLREVERETAPGLVPSPISIGGSVMGATRDTLAAEFGPGVAARWRDYQPVVAARMMAYTTLRVLDLERQPLSDDQRERLVASYRRALAEVPASHEPAGQIHDGLFPPPEPSAEVRARRLELAEALNTRIAQESRDFLTASQHAVLERHLRSQVERQRRALQKVHGPVLETAPAP